MANRFSVTTADGTTVAMNVSRKEARQLVAKLKGEGHKARVVDQQPVSAIAEAKDALRANQGEYAGFENVGEPTDDDARQFIEMTHTGIIPTSEQDREADAAQQVADEARVDAVARPLPVSVSSTAVIEETRADGSVVPPPAVDFLSLGYSLALADLAAARSMTVRDVTAADHILAEVGLTWQCSPAVVRRAEQLYRNAVDGMMWRCDGRRPGEVVPALTVAEANAVIAAPKPVAPPAAKRAPSATSSVGKPRQTIFDHPTTRVVMWMGKEGYTAAHATAVLAHFGVTSTPASIATFIRSGVKGDRGDVAPLTNEQAAQITAIIVAIPVTA